MESSVTNKGSQNTSPFLSSSKNIGDISPLCCNLLSGCLSLLQGTSYVKQARTNSFGSGYVSELNSTGNEQTRASTIAPVIAQEQVVSEYISELNSTSNE